MPNPPLSPGTQRRLETLFGESDREEAAALLHQECGNNLPFLEELDGFRLERFRFAALKLSGGSMAKLREAIELAKIDWRDLLMCADFGEDVHAHEQWFPGNS